MGARLLFSRVGHRRRSSVCSTLEITIKYSIRRRGGSILGYPAAAVVPVSRVSSRRSLQQKWPPIAAQIKIIRRARGDQSKCARLIANIPAGSCNAPLALAKGRVAEFAVSGQCGGIVAQAKYRICVLIQLTILI